MGKLLHLWHPESPGMRITVRRGAIARLFLPREFATLGETLTYYRARELVDFAATQAAPAAASTKESA